MQTCEWNGLLRGAAVVMLIASAAACGDATSTADSSVDMDGATDAAGDVGDSGDSSGGPDADEDGVPADMDCDDGDPSISNTATRTCVGICSEGVETCTDGVWAACEDTLECSCDAPGMMRTVDCGRCGAASQICGDDRMWGPPSECFGELECLAGEIERDMSMCGMSARLCDSACAWLPWETMTPPGDCESGATERTSVGCAAGEFLERTCSASCAWEPGVCTPGCASPPAASSSPSDPVCIPAGSFNFQRHSVLGMGWVPWRTFTLSEFHIDRDPVTKARYEMCVAAGACMAPSDAEYIGAAADEWATVDHDQATAFCAWDGGALPSEFQWEKTARGGVPSEILQPWGGGTMDCTYHPWMGCEQDGPFPVALFPASTSPYAIHLMGTIHEWTGSYWLPDVRSMFLTLPEMDPVTPPSGSFTARGMEWVTDFGSGWSYTFGSFNSALRRIAGSSFATGFRCVY